MNSLLLSISLSLIFGVVLAFESFAESYEALEAPDCAPMPVQNLTISEKFQLTWSPPSNEATCPVGKYLIFISNNESSYVLETTAAIRLVAVGFLEGCKAYNFSVMAVSTKAVEGLANTLTAKTPLPDGLKTISLKNVTLTQNEDGLLLNWETDEHLEQCVHFYRVVYSNEINVVPKDVYINTTSFLVGNVVPCTKYNFKVSAWITASDEGPVTALEYSAAKTPPSRPRIVDLQYTAHTISMTWQLPSYSTNRCPITQFVVDALPQFEVNVTVQDTPLRPNTTINLTNLNSSTVYDCRVSIENSGGLSLPVHVLVQTDNDNVTDTTY